MSYDGDTTRCPWCHAHWALILSSGWHSCEMYRFWPGSDYRWRVATARSMRQAAQKGSTDEAAAIGRYQEPPIQPSGSGCGQRQPPSR